MTPPASPLPSGARRWSGILGGLVLIFAGLAAYRNSFSVPLLLDDEATIVDNPSIRNWWRIGAIVTPAAGLPTAGRPLLNATFAANYALGGTSPRGYHAVNLAILLLGALAFFGIVRRTLLWPERDERSHEAATPLALLAALLWLLHPVLTESVTYLSQRAESLMGLFYLLTLYCFIRGSPSSLAERALRCGDDSSGASRGGLFGDGSSFWFGASWLACLFGMATKEVMVTAPLLILLYDRAFLSGTWAQAWKRRRGYYTGLAATWLLLAFLMATAPLAGRGVGFGTGFTAWTYLRAETIALIHYLRQIAWPSRLVFDPGAEFAAPSLGRLLPCAGFLGLLVAGTVVAWFRRPALGFLGAWFFLILAPTSSFIPVQLQPVAENRIYLSLAAVAVLVTVGSYRAIGKSCFPLLALVAVGLAALTVRRNTDYRSPLAIWSDTVAKRPGSSRAHYNLGVAYSDLPGHGSEAIDQYEQALRIFPNFAAAHTNLGLALLSVPGRFSEGLAHCETAVRLHPEVAVARSNLGLALLQVPGRLPEAISECEAALRIRPDLAEAHNNLGNALLRTPGRRADAVAEYRAALRIKPDFVEAHFNLAVALMNDPAGRQEAKEHLLAALRLRPDLAIARRLLERLR